MMRECGLEVRHGTRRTGRTDDGVFDDDAY
jgi:hypothetical protein